MSPELRHLRHFIAVAEELHFTRAAARLHMAQQPLSASIRRLERELGVELLRRTTRRVELTDAGAALLEQARTAVAAADTAFETTRATARGAAGLVRIGVSPGARYELEPLFDALRAQYPQLRVRPRQASSRMLIEDLDSGAIDLAIGFCAELSPALAKQRLKDEPVIVAVAADHRLAGREAIDLSELRDETFALVDPHDGPGYNAAVLALCRTAGFEPHSQKLHSDLDAWGTAVIRHGCVGLTGRSAIHATHRDMRLLTLTPPATFPLDLLWRPGAPADRPALATLLQLADRVAREHAWLRTAADTHS